MTERSRGGPRWLFLVLPVAPLLLAVWAWTMWPPSTTRDIFVAFTLLIAVFNLWSGIRIFRRR